VKQAIYCLKNLGRDRIESKNEPLCLSSFLASSLSLSLAKNKKNKEKKFDAYGSFVAAFRIDQGE
jgi:hypothetical protein